jgi:hypothetical protein
MNDQTVQYCSVNQSSTPHIPIGSSLPSLRRNSIPRRTERRTELSSDGIAIGRENKMLGTILIVILILALLGVLPRWSHSKQWGYAPTGGLGLILLIVIILLLLGRI